MLLFYEPLAGHYGYQVCPSGFNINNLIQSKVFIATFAVGSAAGIISLAATIYYFSECAAPDIVEDKALKKQQIHEHLEKLKNNQVAINSLKLLEEQPSSEEELRRRKFAAESLQDLSILRLIGAFGATPHTILLTIINKISFRTATWLTPFFPTDKNQTLTRKEIIVIGETACQVLVLCHN